MRQASLSLSLRGLHGIGNPYNLPLSLDTATTFRPILAAQQ